MQDAAASFDLMSPEFRADPYPYYDFMRQFSPLMRMPHWGMWLASRHDDATWVLKDPRFGHDYGVPAGDALEEAVFVGEHAPLWEMQSRWMLLRNAPDHTRLKALVHKAFTPRTVEQMRSVTQGVADRLLDAAAGSASFDLIEAFAYPLPVTVIAQMIGVPAADQASFQGWSRDLVGTLDLDDRQETYDRGTHATVAFSAYLRDLIAERRRAPQDDLLSALIAAEEAGDRLTEQEMVSTLILLLVAGHETTMNLIGNGTLALLRHPDQWAIFREAAARGDGGAIRAAVEELLRYDSPVQLTSRVASEALELRGERIEKGTVVTLLLGGANRDPEAFPDPNTLDIMRADNKHLAFGNGIHYCLGAPLARMEGAIAFTSLANRFPALTLADDAPAYRSMLTIRGLQALRVAV